MRIDSNLFNLNKPPAAVITVNFTGQNGKGVPKKIPVAMPLAVATNTDFETIFMPSVNTFANELGAVFAVLSTANVDVSVTFTNPFAIINANIGEWGSGDVFEVANLNVFLETDKTAVIGIPAPVQTIFVATDGPNRDVINVNSAVAGLLTPLIEAFAGLVPAPGTSGLVHISDGERIDDSLGYNGLSHGKRVTRKLRVKLPS